MAMTISRRAGAEFIGTFWLVLGGCGSAVLAAGFPHLGIGFAGVALAFGLTLLTMAYAIGHISGCHINPAVSFGLWAGGRFPGTELAPYVIAQVLGGIFAAAVLYVIASGAPGFSLAGGFASNGYGAHSPGGYSFPSARVRGRDDPDVPVRDHGSDRPARSSRLRADSDRIGADADSPDQHPGDQHFG